MNNYKMNNKESKLVQKLRDLLRDDPSLAEELEQADIDPERLWDPQDTCYVLDQAPLRHAVGEQGVRDFLRDHIRDVGDAYGQLITQTTEHWERYPLPLLGNLLWRMRDIDGDVTFMRGGVVNNKPLAIWKAEIANEQGNRVMRCYDTERHNYMYLTLRCPEFTMTKGAFLRELQDFLSFEEDTVWILNGSTFGILEVSE